MKCELVFWPPCLSCRGWRLIFTLWKLLRMSSTWILPSMRFPFLPTSVRIRLFPGHVILEELWSLYCCWILLRVFLKEFFSEYTEVSSCFPCWSLTWIHKSKEVFSVISVLSLRLSVAFSLLSRPQTSGILWTTRRWWSSTASDPTVASWHPSTCLLHALIRWPAESFTLYESSRLESFPLCRRFI